MTALLPDIEAIITTYLHDFNVVPETPRDTHTPWARLTLLDAGQTDLPDHLAAGYIQVDCYGGSHPANAQAEASLLARQIRKALVDMPSATHTDAVVSGCSISGMARIPDDSEEPARERFILTADVWFHAT